MSSLLSACRTWLQHNLAWSNSRQSWQERIGFALLVIGAFCAGWFGSYLSLSSQVGIWALLLVGFAVLLRRGWIKLFGPVLFYDMLRVGRRSRYILFRFLYTVGLLLLLFWVYKMWSWDWEYRHSGTVPVHRLAQLAEQFFFMFMFVQLVLVLILTPAFVAGAIAEEKDRKTLEFLLATDLRNREIVLGKLVARLANLTLLVLAGLPILSGLQFVGGVDPDLLLASFAAIGLTMMSLASVSILLSVTSRRPRDAIIFSYLMILLYPAVAWIFYGVHMLLRFLIAAGELEPVLFVPVAEVLDFFSEVLNSGNLTYVLIELGKTLSRGGNIGDVLPDLIRDYALFHIAVTIGCATWAVMRLRAIALRETETKTRKEKIARIMRPPVSDSPMLWKEIWAEPKARIGWFGRILIGILVGSSFLPVLVMFYDQMSSSGRGARRDEWLSEGINVWVRVVGTLVACLLLLSIAVCAAGTVSGERDKQTLDGLLTSPLDTSAILFGKWAGSVLSVRWGWLWLGSIWFIGLITGGLNPCALPMLVAAWLVYAGMFSAVGLWFSVVSHTSLRATVWSLITVLMMAGGHWLVMGMCCFMPCGLMMRSGDGLQYIAKFEAGQTPPAVLAIIAFHSRDLKYTHRDEGEVVFFCFIGVISWAVGTIVLGNLTNARFQALANRDTMKQGFPRTASLQLNGPRPPPPDAGASEHIQPSP